MAEHDENKGVRARSDAAAAVGDDLLPGDPDSFKPLAKLGRR
jgi:hypothetical protein